MRGIAIVCCGSGDGLSPEIHAFRPRLGCRAVRVRVTLPGFGERQLIAGDGRGCTRKRSSTAVAPAQSGTGLLQKEIQHGGCEFYFARPRQSGDLGRVQ